MQESISLISVLSGTGKEQRAQERQETAPGILLLAFPDGENWEKSDGYYYVLIEMNMAQNHMFYLVT